MNNGSEMSPGLAGETVVDLTADLFYVAAIRAGGERGTRLLPLSEFRQPLAPHKRLSERMLIALLAIGYIEPDLPVSQSEDWLCARDGLFRGFESVRWKTRRSPTLASIALENWCEGSDPNRSVLEAWRDMWEDLALAELAEYTRRSLMEAGFNPSWALDAINALTAGLQTFSVRQVMYLVHVTLRSMALSRMRVKAGACGAERAFATSLCDVVQRAIAEHWAVRGLARAADFPRSAIADVFTEMVTELGDRYYSERPSLDVIASALRSRKTTLNHCELHA